MCTTPCSIFAGNELLLHFAGMVYDIISKTPELSQATPMGGYITHAYSVFASRLCWQIGAPVSHYNSTWIFADKYLLSLPVFTDRG
ncbi:MAG TPA: hypothetical protein VH500_24145 [Nitrososphaeraceae archaeon]